MFAIGEFGASDADKFLHHKAFPGKETYSRFFFPSTTVTFIASLNPGTEEVQFTAGGTMPTGMATLMFNFVIIMFNILHR